MLFNAHISLPNGPCARSPSELLAAYRAGEHSEDLWIAAMLTLAIVCGIGLLSLLVVIWRMRVPASAPFDIEAQVERLAVQREEVYTSLAAVQRRLDAEITRRDELAKFVDCAAEEVAPAVARMRADIDMLIVAGFALPPPPGFGPPPGL